MTRGSRPLMWTYIVTSVAAFMVALDNLVVTMALPSIREHLHASLQALEWTVNAYTLTFAVLLLPAAALGDRLGRRRVFVGGLALFTVASAAAALAPSAGALIAARAVQGVGGAAVLPLSLTLLTSAVPANRRGAALGVWGAMSGLAVALGPLLGGAITQGASWQFIFWLNVPIGIAIAPLAARRLPESYGAAGAGRRLDLPGLALVSAGLFGIVLGLVRGNDAGWTSTSVLGSIVLGGALLIAFVVRERTTADPMLPLGLFRSRQFSAANAASLFMSIGMFGSIFLLSQFLQAALGYSPVSAGLRTLPWTAMPVLIAPLAGPLSDRIGGKPLLTTGLFLQAGGLLWLTANLSVGMSYGAMVFPFILCGIGMALFFVPVASVVMGSVPTAAQGVASGTNNGIRELGGVLGISVLGAVFSAQGSLANPQAFLDGLKPAVVVGALVLAAGGVAALALPGRRSRATSAEQAVPVPAGSAAAVPVEV